MSTDSVGVRPRCRSISKRATAIKRRAARCVPQSAKRGYADGRVRGQQFAAHDVAYVGGAVVGFVCGAAEAAMQALAGPVNWLFGDAEPAGRSAWPSPEQGEDAFALHCLGDVGVRRSPCPCGQGGSLIGPCLGRVSA